MKQQFSRISLIILMAFAVCSFVPWEDVRESDAAYSRTEMLKISQQELTSHRKVFGTRLPAVHSQKEIFAEAKISSPTLLSLAVCTLRC
jgi:hypothetical protein